MLLMLLLSTGVAGTQTLACRRTSRTPQGIMSGWRLGRAVGRSLTHLQVDCRLSEDFWPAVWAHLPRLQVLTIRCWIPSDISLPDLASFCSSATRPLQLLRTCTPFLECEMFDDPWWHDALALSPRQMYQEGVGAGRYAPALAQLHSLP
jgi:hypothetical protein